MKFLKTSILFILIVLCSSSSVLELGIQPKIITQTFFPDPDIEIPTPGFSKKKGYTSITELLDFLKKKSLENPNQLSISFIGKSQGDIDIPAVRLIGKNPVENPIRVWLQGGLHGNEMGSVEGLLFLIHELLNEANFLDEFEMMIIPIANPDGYKKENRYAKNGMDLNRDHTIISAPETKYLKSAFNLFDPELALDFHEYRPFRRDFVNFGNFGVTSMYDVMFLHTSNPNVPKGLRDLIEDSFITPCHTDLDKQGYTHHNYFSTEKHLGTIRIREGSTSARSSSTSYALSNCVSSLIEIRGVGLGRTSFKRRVSCVREVGMSFLKSAVRSKNNMRRVLANLTDTNRRVVYSSSYLTENRIMNFIDLEEKSIRGFDFEVRDLSEQRNIKTRPFPLAYLLREDLIPLIKPKLDVLGITYQLISSESLDKSRIYSYDITKYLQDGIPEFRVRRQRVSSKLSRLESIGPVELLYVPTSQLRGAHLFELFEPEASSSYVAFDLIHTGLNKKLKYYRYHVH